jgi:hypothetical protein
MHMKETRYESRATIGKMNQLLEGKIDKRILEFKDKNNFDKVHTALKAFFR